LISAKQKLLEEARVFPRRRCKWHGLLKQEDTHRPCVVEDISVGGCRIATNSKDLEPGQRVTVEIESRKLRFYGELRWVRAGEAGVEFLYMD
jgi:predicted SPOUT superfamily RNA methylase MTH1